MLGSALQIALGSVLYARRAVIAAERGLSALAVGLLCERRLTDLTLRYYSKNDRYLRERDIRSGLKDWEAAAIDAYFPSRGRVLVLSAGAGREVLALRDRGLEVYAAECAARYVEHMRTLFGGDGGVRGVYLVAPNEAPKELPPMDAVLMGWGGYTYVPGRRARIGLLRDMSLLLAPGGVLLFSFWAERGAGTARLDQLSRRLSGLAQRSIISARVAPAEPGDRVVPPGFYGHVFNRDEVEAEVREAGLRLELYDSKTYGHAVARRIEPDEK